MEFTKLVESDYQATIRLKSLAYEDFVQYQKPCMFLGFSFCDFKCQKENPDCHCQNIPAYNTKIITCVIYRLLRDYQMNPITRAIVLGGFEPLLQFNEVVDLIRIFRSETMDDIVIYTGYREDEIATQIGVFSKYPNILMKVGRFIPNQTPHYDPVLGVKLASSNQYGIRL